jgi:2-oxoisovalerate dehydrogenase E1 component
MTFGLQSPATTGAASLPTDLRSAGLPRSSDSVDQLRGMLFIRRFEERVLTLRQAEQISGSIHLCVGQESAPIGVLSALDQRDRVLSTYRGHGWALASGVPPQKILDEIMGRASGTNGGRGGSAYLSSPEHGFLGENSIVAAGLPIANGVAMGLQKRGEGGVVVVSFGDGATNQGAAHEALLFAVFRSLPVVFICENNRWSEMTPISATVPGVQLHERAAAYGMAARRIDGSDVGTVTESAAWAVERARSGQGPTFLEIDVPRILGHYNADIEHYRSAADRQEHLQRDPIPALTARLLDEGTLSEADLALLEDDVLQAVSAIEQAALAADWPDPTTVRDHVVAPLAPPTPASPAREGAPMKYGIAANHAMARELADRPEVVLFGEDIAIPGGTFGVTRNLQKQFGARRVFDTPISEAAILGAAVGASQEGLRPVVEIMWSDFLFVAFDQVINQAANVRYLSRGTTTAPLVIRMQQGITPGSCAQHSQSIEALLAHIPGLKVGMPSTPQDAYSMLRAAIADPDPVVIIESRALYQDTGAVDLDAEIEFVGGARLRRPGTDVLIVTWGGITKLALQAAESLAALYVDAAVLELRWLNPLDEPALAEAVAAAGGKVLIVHEANVSGGFGAEVSARLAENHLDLIDGPIRRIGLPDVRVPASPGLQAALLPTVETIAAAARSLAEH